MKKLRRLRDLEGSMSRALLVLLFCVGGHGIVDARGGWEEPVGGFDYSYEASAGQGTYHPAFDALGCLDGEWRRSSNSDQWDGSGPEPDSLRPDGMPGAPGGVAIQALPGEGEDGSEASVLDMEDVGDPRAEGINDPSNRRIFLWRNTSSELNLFLGVTLAARWRLNPAPKAAAFATNGGVLPVPNGTQLSDQNKGQLGFVQKSPIFPGTVAAGLGFAITDGGRLQFAEAFTGNPCAGASDELCFEVDESEWVSIWMTAKEDLLTPGGLRVKVFLNGASIPVMDRILTGIRADSESASLPESGGAAASYVYVGLGSTAQDGAIQIDFLSILSGATDPVADCNSNGVPDNFDIRDGDSLDCNTNGKPDQCELSAKTDCNATGIPDGCDISSGASQDCNANGKPDECDVVLLDCNENGQPDDCDVTSGVSPDCDLNGVPDSCDIASTTSPDCNGNGVPDACDIASGSSLDCNANGVPDSCDVASGTSPDCNANGVPDTCDIASSDAPDCNANGIPDACDIAGQTSPDCNASGRPDECELSENDCDQNLVPDSCDIAAGSSLDCNLNGLPDACDVASGFSADCNADSVPDECDIAGGTSPDCNQTGVPDECDVASGARPDCNLNGVPDECDVAGATSPDINANGLPDECEPAFIRGDANCDGRSDISDSVWTLNYLFGGGSRPCCGDSADVNDDGKVDISDPIRELNYLFQGGPAPPSPGPDLPCGVDPTNDDNDERLPCAYPEATCAPPPPAGG